MASTAVSWAARPSTLGSNSPDSRYGSPSLTPSATEVYKPLGRNHQAEHPNELHHKHNRKILLEELFSAPISDEPNYILDLDAGTGTWAMAVAERYPNAMVLGIEISSSQQRVVPPNCYFLRENMDKTLDRAVNQDFIHCRGLRMCLNKERRLRQVFAALRPGGWFEIAEMTLPLLDDDALKGTHLQAWAEHMEASGAYDTPFDKPDQYEKLMKEAGFCNIKAHIRDVSPYPDKGELKDLGEHQEAVLREGLEIFGLQMHVNVLSWSKDKRDVCLAQVRKELASSRVKASCRWIRVFGQKPRSLTIQPASLSENSMQLLEPSTNTQNRFTSHSINRQQVLSAASELAGVPGHTIKLIPQAKGTYAPYIPDKTCAEHQDLIQQESATGATKNQILKSLKKNRFCPTITQEPRHQIPRQHDAKRPHVEDHRHFNPNGASSSLRSNQILEATSKHRELEDAQAPYTERAPPLSTTPSIVGFHGLYSPSPPKPGIAILAKNVGGRKGPLPPEVAEKVSEMRDIGACLRCRLFRNRCDGNQPCSECCKPARNWKLGCTRAGLADRVHCIFPNILLAKIQQGNDEITTSKDNGRPFHLALTHELSERQLYLYVHTVRSRDQTIIVPYWNKDGEQQDLEQTLRDWLDGVIEDSNFCQEEFCELLKNELWEQKVLAEIYDHNCRTEEGRRRLEQALRLTYLVSALKNPFTSLADAARHKNIPGLHGYKMPLPQVSPLSAAKVTASVCAYFKLLVTQNLKDLDMLLMSRPAIEDTEAAFCEVFLCLISLGQYQNSVLNHMPDMTYSIAHDQIRQLENDVVDYIIELSICKVRKQALSQARKSSTSSLSPFFDRLLHITLAHTQDLHDQTELSEMDPDTFELRNVSRLLSRLCYSVSEFWVKIKKPPEVKINKQQCNRRMDISELIHTTYQPPQPPTRVTDTRQAQLAERSNWSDYEEEELVRLRGDGMSWPDITKKLPGRDPRSCCNRKHYLRKIHKDRPTQELRGVGRGLAYPTLDQAGDPLVMPVTPERTSVSPRPETPTVATAIPALPLTPENDSTYEGSLQTNSTASLPESAYEVLNYCGREYQAGEHGYPYPMDETEQDNLDLQHAAFLEMLGGKLCATEGSLDSRVLDVGRILDVGTGTGIWAIEMADKYCKAAVVGIDISPIQPTWVAPNCKFLREDANETWNFAGKFDFIHCRQSRGCLDEKKLMKQAFENLLPGGHIELTEMVLPLICNDGSWEGTHLKSWVEDMLEASMIIGKPFDKPYQYQEWMKDAGFVNVQEIVNDVALNTGDKLGFFQRASLSEGLEGYSLHLYTNVLKWNVDKFNIRMACVREELRKCEIQVSYRCIRVLGQKPESNATWLSQLASLPNVTTSSIISTTSAAASISTDCRLISTSESAATISTLSSSVKATTATTNDTEVVTSIKSFVNRAEVSRLPTPRLVLPRI